MIDVLVGMVSFIVIMFGGFGDVDLFVKFGS